MNRVKPKIKICCIKSKEELDIVAKYRDIDHVGFVSDMPSGPGIISIEDIQNLVEYTPKSIDSFLLTSLSDADEIVQQHNSCKTEFIQLCKPLEDSELKKLRRNLNGTKIIGVIHVSGEESIHRAKNLQQFVDAILLDTGNPNGTPPILGGTGRTHNWDISREVRQQVSVPIYLAGGLNYKNVVDAMEQVEPYGLDVCCGVRTADDKLDENKLQSFLKAVSDYLQK